MEWKLKDLTVDGKGSYGIGAPAVPYQEDKLTYLRITDINDDGSLNFSDLKSVDAEDAEKYILKENDIVFARTGNSTGRSYFYEKQHGTFVYAGFLIKFSLDPNKVNPRILKYYTHSKPYFDWVNSFDTGATRGNINAKTYGDMEIELPSRKVQDKIVSILSSLDRKIELNNKINADLEEMAQAIFKNWFVDFEPFKDGKFVDSELGMIPEGWKVGCLGDMGNIVCGKTPSKTNSNYYGGDIPFIKIPDMHGNVFVESSEDRLTELGSLSQIKKLILPYSLMVSCIATVGLVSINTKPSHTNQQINTVIPHNKSALFYLYQHMKNNEEFLKNMGRGGTTTLNVNTRSFSNIRLLIPSEIALEQFHRVVEGLFKKIELNLHESRTLSTLRDTLLPRLMSGELEVPE